MNGRRLRLHPEAGGSARSCSSPPAARSSGARSSSSGRQHQELLERRVTEATSELAATVRHLEETYRVTLEALGSAIDTRDVGTHAHSRRVRGYSLAIAARPRRARIAAARHRARRAAPRHRQDRHSRRHPPEAGCRSRRRSGMVMRTHPDIGRRLVEKIPFLRGAVPIVYNHHERWDGTGYPSGTSRRGDPARAAHLRDSRTRSTP